MITLTSPLLNADGTPRTNEKGETIYVVDDMVDKLLEEETLTKNRNTAYQKSKELSEEQRRKYRIRAKRDLFFLCYSILGNNRLSPNLHGHLCAHVQKTAYRRFHEYLLFRGGFKSTILTIGKNIQTVLPVEEADLKYDGWWLDGEQSEMPYPANLGTDCRILIGHETHEGSARFLYAITSHFLSNVLLMGLFPEAVPSPRKQTINKWGLELPRTSSGNPEPTIDTLGVGGKSQGRHYNHISLDDIFGDKARDSEAEAETVRQWFDNIQSFFSLFSKDTLDLTGTRYSHDDVYAHAEERYGDQLCPYIRKIEEVDPQTGEKYIIFPEEFSKEALEIIKKNKKVYNAQYLNDPEESDAGFGKDKGRHFYWRGINEIITFDADERMSPVTNVRDLDICFLIDPGLGKSGGFVVTGMDYLKRIFTLVALRLEMKSPELTELVFKQVARWQPRVVAIESDMFAETFEHWWNSEMVQRGIRFHIAPVHTAKRHKDARIEGLAPYMASQQFFYNESQTDLARELKTWGKSKDIHILDALAYGPEVWRPGHTPGSRGLIATSIATGTDDRDIETGYSAIGD
jgi:hypothetical protein